MEKVVVLMSTYNGEKYVAQQLDSILSQTNVDVDLYVRDDGSTDSTLHILKAYEDAHCNVTVNIGNNVGWRKSFSELLVTAPPAQYYAFADQDDLWLKEKLQVALAKIQPYTGIPCLYRGRSYIADSTLNNTGLVFQDIPVPDITRSLFQNFCQGCTLVFNAALRNQYLKYPINTVSHDVWLPLLALHTGKIIDDSVPHMLYRVHSSNATAGESWYGTWLRRFKGIQKKSASKLDYNYGEALYNNFKNNLHLDSVEICRKMSCYRSDSTVKLHLLLDKKVRGNSFLRSFMVKYFIFTNSYRCY